jgi:hypothetical protein
MFSPIFLAPTFYSMNGVKNTEDVPNSSMNEKGVSSPSLLGI